MQSYPWKHVWITGASSGIGRELAVVLSKAGVKVSVSARSVDALDALAAEHNGIDGYPLDVTDEDATARTVTAIETERGPIDLAVLNAGFWELSDSSDLKLEMFRKSMAVNYLGVANCLVPLLATMARRGSGQVGVMASVAGYRGLPRSAYYGPTKAALNNLCESLQPDFTRMGLKLQIINPGFVRTPMTDRNDFPMPFLMEPSATAAQILKGLTSDRFEIAFPWQLVAMLKFARILPLNLYLWLIKRFVART
jgi:short-subunit dehydrogenase